MKIRVQTMVRSTTNCQYLWIDCGFAMCDCAHQRAGGQINDRGTCDPTICKLTKKEKGEKHD